MKERSTWKFRNSSKQRRQGGEEPSQPKRMNSGGGEGRSLRSEFLLFLILIIQTFPVYTAAAADKSASITITSPPAAPSYSKQLGVQAAPVTVVVDSVEQHGLFIYSNPNKALGKALKLRQNVLLLSLDGYAVSSVETVDSYLERRPKNKALTYEYIPSLSGASGEGQIHTGKYEMTPASNLQQTAKPQKTK